MKQNYFLKLHRIETTWKDGGQTTLVFEISKTYLYVLLKRPWFFVFQKIIKRSTLNLSQFSAHRNYIEKVHQNDVDHSSIEITSTKYVEMRKNSSIFPCQPCPTCSVCWYNIKTKLVLVSTPNHSLFNNKFWRCARVNKMIIFRRSNPNLFNINIKIITSWVLKQKNDKSTLFQL